MQGVARISSSFREMPGGVRLCNFGKRQAAHQAARAFAVPREHRASHHLTAPRGGVPIAPPRGTRPFDGRFRRRCRRPGRACVLRLRFCAHLSTVLESRLSSAQHSVVGLPVEMTQSAVPRGLAELQARRRMIAAEAHRRLVPGCNGHGRWRVSAGGGYRRGAGVSIHAQGPGSWKAIPRCSCSGRSPCAEPSPSEGGKIRAPCMI